MPLSPSSYSPEVPRDMPNGAFHDERDHRHSSPSPPHLSLEAVTAMSPMEHSSKLPETVRSALSNPFVAAGASGGLVLAGVGVWWRFFKRIPNAQSITPSVLRWRRVLKGKVTNVGDADNFRFYHTPGPLGFIRRVPTDRRALKDNTISIRLAGIDAPEGAHFGKPAQPYSEEALKCLKELVDGRKVRLKPFKVDQYQRLVAMAYVWRFPYIFGPTNISLSMLRAGLAAVYRAQGHEYGGIFNSLERAEAKAKNAGKGMWSLGKKLELPADYKRRHKIEDG